MLRNSIGLVLLLLVSGCYERYPYETGTFQELQPINLSDLNSEFDDMNSDFNPPVLNTGVSLIFSSNAPSKGGDFDLLNRDLRFIWDKELGTLSHDASRSSDAFRDVRNRIFEVNSDCSEKGPYSFVAAKEEANKAYMLFSRDCSGVFQVWGSSNESLGPFNGYKIDEFEVRLMDTQSNEMYPTFYGEDFLKSSEWGNQGNIEKLLFSSDRDGDFDIFEMDIPTNQDLEDFLKSDQERAVRKIDLNTSSNDHMPFVYGDMLVFSSDRPGGLGGYDLYYSLKTAEGWMDPVNFGPTINSPQDEYRPVVSDHRDFSNRVMIFSSNRPGGLGGFDLYYVGVPRF